MLSDAGSDCLSAAGKISGSISWVARTFWTEEKFESLKRMVAERMSAGAIAEVLGCTRNAVIGKCHRRGLKLNSVLVGRPTQNPDRLKPRPSKPRVFKQKKFAFVSAATAPPESLNLTIAQLERHHCRWIENDFYCGNDAVSDTSWCPYHGSFVYQHPARRRAA